MIEHFALKAPRSSHSSFETIGALMITIGLHRGYYKGYYNGYYKDLV